MKELKDIRKDYRQGFLLESDVKSNPIEQFQLWIQQAIEAEVNEPNALNLATVGKNGRPSSRIVLLRSIDEHGFVFYTNYKSRKGSELIENPYACMDFFWPELERQVRIEGKIERVSEDVSDKYFKSRPHDSQIGALASDQSSVLKSREELDEKVKSLNEQYKNDVPRPAHWGGFCLNPDYIEFWQGRANRLHDRLAYTLEVNGNWKIERLSP